jgi:hypothetical protein
MMDVTFSAFHTFSAFQADSSGAVSYLLTNGHGSTRALTNSAGAVTQTFNYTAFGGAIGFSPAAAGTISTSTAFLFGGDAVYDPASGLYLHGDGTRPRDGFIFTQMDNYPGNTRDPVSLHKYLYVAGTPTSMVDPSGHLSAAETVSAVGLGIGLVGLGLWGGGTLFHAPYVAAIGQTIAFIGADIFLAGALWAIAPK